MKDIFEEILHLAGCNDKIITDVDPYNHDELIVCTNTYKKFAKVSDSLETINIIKENKLLKKFEGFSYNKKLKQFKKDNCYNINYVRTKIGMVFQNFNLFNNLTVLDNLILYF